MYSINLCDNGGHYIGQRIRTSSFIPWCEFVDRNGEKQVLGIRCTDINGIEYYIPTSSIRVIVKELEGKHE